MRGNCYFNQTYRVEHVDRLEITTFEGHKCTIIDCKIHGEKMLLFHSLKHDVVLEHCEFKVSSTIRSSLHYVIVDRESIEICCTHDEPVLSVNWLTISGSESSVIFRDGKSRSFGIEIKCFDPDDYDNPQVIISGRKVGINSRLVTIGCYKGLKLRVEDDTALNLNCSEFYFEGTNLDIIRHKTITFNATSGFFN